jgi:hypothetical protein
MKHFWGLLIIVCLPLYANTATYILHSEGKEIGSLVTESDDKSYVYTTLSFVIFVPESGKIVREVYSIEGSANVNGHNF